MSQLSTVTASLLALSIAILNFGASKSPPTVQVLLWYMVLLLMNFLAAYVFYQNVQVTALQQHIAYLERRLGATDIFRWETVIARIWYGTNLRSNLLNILLLVPPIGLLMVIYAGVAAQLGLCSPHFNIPLLLNIVYLCGLIYGFVAARSEVSRINQPILAKLQK